MAYGQETYFWNDDILSEDLAELHKMGQKITLNQSTLNALLKSLPVCHLGSDELQQHKML